MCTQYLDVIHTILSRSSEFNHNRIKPEINVPPIIVFMDIGMECSISTVRCIMIHVATIEKSSAIDPTLTINIFSSQALTDVFISLPYVKY